MLPEGLPVGPLGFRATPGTQGVKPGWGVRAWKINSNLPDWKHGGKGTSSHRTGIPDPEGVGSLTSNVSSFLVCSPVDFSVHTRRICVRTQPWHNVRSADEMQEVILGKMPLLLRRSSDVVFVVLVLEDSRSNTCLVVVFFPTKFTLLCYITGVFRSSFSKLMMAVSDSTVCVSSVFSSPSLRSV